MYRILLIWYQNGDTIGHHSNFCEAKDGPFDMVVGSHLFARSMTQTTIMGWLQGRKLVKAGCLTLHCIHHAMSLTLAGDREKDNGDHARHLEEQHNQELQDRNTLHMLQRQTPLQGQAPIRGPAVATQAPLTGSLDTAFPLDRTQFSTSSAQTHPLAQTSTPSTGLPATPVRSPEE